MPIDPGCGDASSNRVARQHEVNAHTEVLVEHSGPVVPVREHPVSWPAIAHDVAERKLAPEEIDEALIARHLYTADLPELDLLIRPGGEHRLSNFLLYQAAYAELVMTDVFWPDFSGKDLIAAVVEFQHRERRFGGA